MGLAKTAVKDFYPSDPRVYVAQGSCGFNPYNAQQPKAAWQFLLYLAGESLDRNICEGEMLIRMIPTTLFQIFL